MTNLRLLHYAQQCLLKSHSFTCTLGHSSADPTDEVLYCCGRPPSFILSMTRIKVNLLFYVSFSYGPPNMVAASSHAQPQVYMESPILFSKQVIKATSVKRNKATFCPQVAIFWAKETYASSRNAGCVAPAY